MALASTDFGSNLGLRQPVRLDFFNEFRPVHRSKYRIRNLECQRLCDIYLVHDYGMDTFAERVRASRKKAMLNQQQLAKKAGLSQTTISDIERGRNEGSRDVVALANALGVSAEWLIRGGVISHPDDDPDGQAVREFTRVYSASTDEGRDFLRSAIAAAESAFARPAEQKDHKKKQA